MKVSTSAAIWTTLVAILFVGVPTAFSAGHHRFGYTKPEQRRWSKAHESCAGKHQSPIAITSSKAIPLNMPGIELVGYNNLLPGPITLHNNGHSVSLGVPKTEPAKGKHPYIFGGKMENEYELEGLHFHWGDKNNRGAEHVLNDIRYPLEMHIIHRNKKYKSVPEALGYADGLTVLGFFYQVSEHDSAEIGSLLRSFPLIEEYDHQAHLNFTFTLNSLIGEIDLTRFYTYKGSLTTPPCSEAVTWVLFSDPLNISITQIRRFRLLDTGMHGSPMVDNYRALQPLGNRRIFVRKVNARNTPLDVVQKEIDYTRFDWVY
ncbi:carbonic anhydrase 7 [Toxorhynchites rutilus septentrionalis]|uniref:carbonic anhydrase 7 n=1 Tax=Toxorhynchites rutilus septentrionalis TaxID=329112 RepID=UPI00247930AD|nr:carbonic anhydrase 7 [Toxorhynchites rutilus septentrionalis]